MYQLQPTDQVSSTRCVISYILFLQLAAICIYGSNFMNSCKCQALGDLFSMNDGLLTKKNMKNKKKNSHLTIMSCLAATNVSVCEGLRLLISATMHLKRKPKPKPEPEPEPETISRSCIPF
jgi:hypothetical protein